MPNNNTVLLSGSPRFSDGKLAALALTEGPAAAWHAALQSTPKTAAQGVSGDFAVGLREPGGRTFLAVDRFAIRTLCYRVDNGQLRFASGADELAGTDTEIDPQAIFDYLYFHVIPSPRTIYKGIYRLPPGHYALFENGELTVAPYWVPTFEEQRGVSFDTLKDEFRHLLRDAVATQLDGSKPACFLSGGTDSSTIAGMVAQASGKTAATYSIGFDAQGYDEMEFARFAAKHFKTEHHEYYVTPDDLVRSIPTVAAHYDQPFGNSSALPAYYCAKMAREDGVSKLLAGDGGDELFGGNTRYAKQRMFGWYDHVPGLIKNGLLEPLLGTGAAAAFALTRKAGSYVEQARVPMPDRLQMYNLITRLGVSEVLTPQLLAQIDTTGPLRLERAVWQSPQGCSHLNQELAFDWRFTLAESDLPKVLGTTGLVGVGVGFPMLDDRLLAFSEKLPTAYKLKGQKLRWFFKEALRGFLPDEILAKKKQGFGLPFGVWVNTHPALKTLATDSLHSLARRGVVRTDFVQVLLTQRLSEHPGYYGEMVWILMMLEQWLGAKAPQFSLSS
ncbi:MAG: asparagine synthase [Rhodoferax sp.]|uniref:asparagine synthetase B family protein n=1 Tax=Rhodoferax sp. TaxID=50421 RepID=UPI0017AF91D2|nr:asparagine synthase-related protein [Rhodoferax sp.]NMM15550.1 asparagine synthase [Rhodoferax sp.]NMM21347.1 asparagine synthase [Rhodoferax sp.]